jgi:hypothetical protein
MAAAAKSATQMALDSIEALLSHDRPRIYSPALQMYTAPHDEFISPRVGTRGPHLSESADGSAEMEDSAQPVGHLSTTNAPGAAADTAPRPSKSASSSSASEHSLEHRARSYVSTPPLNTTDETEIQTFIQTRLNKLKALLTQRDKTQTSLDSLSKISEDSIPKALQTADLSAQVPATQPEERKQIRDARDAFHKATVHALHAAQTKELSRVNALIQGFREIVISEFAAYLKAADAGTFGLDAYIASVKDLSLTGRLRTSLDEHLLRVSRQHAAKMAPIKAKEIQRAKEQEERKEAMADAPVQENIRQLVDAAVARKLGGASHPPSTKSRKKAAAGTGKKKTSSPPKNGQSHKSKKPPKGASKDKGKGSGSLGHKPNKNSRGGPSSPSNKSKRK